MARAQLTGCSGRTREFLQWHTENILLHGSNPIELWSSPVRQAGAKGSLYHVTEETEIDRWEVEALYDLCFAPGREALSSYRLRDGVPPIKALCLTARDADGILAAAIRYWPVHVGTADTLLLGPVAVHPTRQGEGLGGLLISESMARSRALGWTRVLLVGDAPYYNRFGFNALSGVLMPPPTNPDRVLGFGDWEGISGPVLKWDASIARS